MRARRSRQSNLPKPVPVSTLRNRSRDRIVVLNLLLVGALIVGICERGTELRRWWLTRQSVETLRQSASESPDELTRCIYAEKLFERNEGGALGAFLAAESTLSPDSSDPTAEHILAILGYLLAVQDRDEEAAVRLTRAQKLDDTDTFVHLGLGLILMHRRIYDKAIVQFRLAVEADAESAEGWRQLGRAFATDNKPLQAVEPFQHALKLRPRDDTICEELGVTYAQQKQYSHAADKLKCAYDLRPNNIDYQIAYASILGFAAQSENDYKQAVTALYSCLQSKPDHNKAVGALGKLYFRFNHPKDAARCLERYLQFTPNDTESWYTYAQALKQAGDKSTYKAAERRFLAITTIQGRIGELRTRLGADSKNAALIVELAEYEFNHGDYVDAIQGYHMAVSLKPDDVELNRRLERVTQMYNEAYRKDPAGDYAYARPTADELKVR